MKFNFQKVLPRARKTSPAYHGQPTTFKVKNLMAWQARDSLKHAGWQIEGEVRGEHTDCYGMVKGTEHISVSDWGKFPFHLGDVIIRVETMNRNYQAPINLR